MRTMKTKILLMTATAVLLGSCTQADWDEAIEYMTSPSSVDSAHVAH